jgi:hypothetical protein
MVDHTLLAQVLQLDKPSRLELWAAIDGSFDDGYVAPEIAAIIDQRLIAVRNSPDDYLTIDESEREVQSRSAS